MKIRRQIVSTTLSFTMLMSVVLPGLAVDVEAPPTVTPEDRLQGKWWGPRHEEKVAQAKAGNVDLVMVGDSITHNWERQKNYAKAFEPYNTLNLGFGGDRTQHVLWRIQNGEIDGISPKLVTMMIGTNNMKDDAPGDIAAGIEAIVAELRQRLPDARVVVLSIFPRKHPRTPGDTEKVRAVNDLLPAIVDNKHVFHVDLNEHFLTEDGGLRVECYGKDLLHLSNQGYATWLAALQPILADAGLVAPTATEESPAEGAADRPVIRLWPIEMVGGEENRLKEEFRKNKGGKLRLTGIRDPNLTVYQVESKTPTPAVIYCPGGAYKILGKQPQVIEWLNGLGVTVFMLKYTVPDDREAAFRDVQRAMRLVRHQAGTWNVDRERIGLIGQSAGGHLSARLSQNYDQLAYELIDEADRESCEPHFAILVSAAYFLGQPAGSDLTKDLFHMNNPVAPTFLVYAKDDKFCKGGETYAKALQEAGVPCHIQLYDKGGHGLRNVNWFPVCKSWLEEQNMID